LYQTYSEVSGKAQVVPGPPMFSGSGNSSDTILLERDDDKFAEQVNPTLDKANALGQKILKAE